MVHLINWLTTLLQMNKNYKLWRNVFVTYPRLCDPKQSEEISTQSIVHSIT